jgi:hypothetical protein
MSVSREFPTAGVTCRSHCRRYDRVYVTVSYKDLIVPTVQAQRAFGNDGAQRLAAKTSLYCTPDTAIFNGWMLMNGTTCIHPRGLWGCGMRAAQTCPAYQLIHQ